jgi:hypothetical protein
MNRYWFRPKRYGYGATPTTWEGWAVTVAACVIVVGSVAAMNVVVDRSDFGAWMVWAVLIAGAIFWFVRLVRNRTDGEWRWRWGDGAGMKKT